MVSVLAGIVAATSTPLLAAGSSTTDPVLALAGLSVVAAAALLAYARKTTSDTAARADRERAEVARLHVVASEREARYADVMGKNVEAVREFATFARQQQQMLESKNAECAAKDVEVKLLRAQLEQPRPRPRPATRK